MTDSMLLEAVLKARPEWRGLEAKELVMIERFDVLTGIQQSILLFTFGYLFWVCFVKFFKASFMQRLLVRLV